MSFRVLSTRRDPWVEADRLRQVATACANGKRILIVGTSKAQENRTTVRLIRLAGLLEVHRWKKTGLLNFRIV